MPDDQEVHYKDDIIYKIDEEQSKYSLLPKGEFKLICKGSDLTEDIAKGFVEDRTETYSMWFNGGKCYKGAEGIVRRAEHAFITFVESTGYHWGENPIKIPKQEEFGYSYADAFDGESGWMYEGGEDKYYEALGKYELEKSRTLKPEKCLIFEIL